MMEIWKTRVLYTVRTERCTNKTNNLEIVLYRLHVRPCAAAQLSCDGCRASRAQLKGFPLTSVPVWYVNKQEILLGHTGPVLSTP